MKEKVSADNRVREIRRKTRKKCKRSILAVLTQVPLVR